MNNEEFAKYNQKRNELLRKYKIEKLKAVFLIFAIGLLELAITWGLFAVKFINIAVALVLTAVLVMLTVILARIRAVTVNHTRDEKLRLFEDSDPTFY